MLSAVVLFPYWGDVASVLKIWMCMLDGWWIHHNILPIYAQFLSRMQTECFSMMFYNCADVGYCLVCFWAASLFFSGGWATGLIDYLHTWMSSAIRMITDITFNRETPSILQCITDSALCWCARRDSTRGLVFSVLRYILVWLFVGVQ